MGETQIVNGLAARSGTRTMVFLAVAVLANSFGNLLIALGMGRMPDFATLPLHGYLLGLVANPFLLPGAALLAVFTFAQISLFSWADLSWVVPSVASSYILSTILGALVLHERVAPLRWIGVSLIFVGVTLVVETPEVTREHPHQAEP